MSFEYKSNSNLIVKSEHSVCIDIYMMYTNGVIQTNNEISDEIIDRLCVLVSASEDGLRRSDALLSGGDDDQLSDETLIRTETQYLITKQKYLSIFDSRKKIFRRISNPKITFSVDIKNYGHSRLHQLRR